MKTSFAKLAWPAIILLAITVFLACRKEASSSGTGNLPPGKAKLSVFLTDGPYDFQKVLIDIKSIQVLVDTCHHFGDPDGDENDHNDGDAQEGDGNNNDGDHHDGE